MPVDKITIGKKTVSCTCGYKLNVSKGRMAFILGYQHSRVHHKNIVDIDDRRSKRLEA